MKHNLKTFPKASIPVSQMTSSELLDHILKLVHWKGDFKEELQQRPGIAVLDGDDNEIDQLVSKKEILG